MSISSVIGAARTIDELDSLMIAFTKVGGLGGRLKKGKHSLNMIMRDHIIEMPCTLAL